MASIEQLEKWLHAKEYENLEFKKAERQYDWEKLIGYCVALSNEMGGYLILGVSDDLPRKVTGTSAFPNYKDIQKSILDTIKIRVEITELFYYGKRVLIFSIPPRPVGTPIHYKGAYLMRVGESLEPMTPEQLKKIFNESQPDFSALPCFDATLDDISQKALESLKILWFRKSNNPEILSQPVEQILTDLELYDGKYLNYASLIILGNKKSLSRFLPNSEIIFEYRNNEANIESQQRKEFREGFLAIQDEVWELINLRNEVEHIQEGFFVRDIPNFNEEVIREGLLNAVCHRDYNLQGSIFIKQYPKTLDIESPGGFPAGITPDNIIFKHLPRNRRIAEVFQKCGLVERSGQGVDKMFRRSIEESKPRPDFSKSDSFSVNLKIKGDIQDKQFLMFFGKIAQERQISWPVIDLILLDDIRLGNQPTSENQEAVNRLRNLGIIETTGSGRGTKYILSKKFYSFAGEKGTYTRKKGLDTEEKKALILRHLKNYNKGTIKEFEQVLPSLDRIHIKYLLKQLKTEKKIKFIGNKKSGHWELE